MSEHQMLILHGLSGKHTTLNVAKTESKTANDGLPASESRLALNRVRSELGHMLLIPDLTVAPPSLKLHQVPDTLFHWF